MENLLLQAEQIEKWYFRKSEEANRFFAVKKADLQLQSGRLAVLTGRSGSGKTTLLHMLGGLLQPDAGSVKVMGQDLYAMPDKQRSRFRNANIAVILQGQSALPWLSVLENVLLPAQMYAAVGDKDLTGTDFKGKDLNGKDLRQKAIELLERFGIGELSHVDAKELSGGELRRMAIARAFLCGCSVLLADEPTADLDDENTELVMRAFREAADAGAAVMVATHETQALAYADMHWKMNAGELQCAVTE